MTTNFSPGSIGASARIYQFPVGGRASLRQREDETKPAADARSQRVSSNAASGAWYHEAAIQDSKRIRER